MAINQVGSQGTGAESATSGNAAQSRAKLASDMNNFLSMLTTQLKNQDPLSPMDSNEFTSQLVQFASVEQQISANQNLEDLLTVTKYNQAGLVLGYVGRSVEMEGGTLPLVDGKVGYAYTTPADVKKITVAITDQSGRVVYSGEGDTQPGAHKLEWTGKDSSGKQLPDGSYRLSVTAMLADGKEAAVATTTTATVTGVGMDGGEVELMLGSSRIALDKVIAIGAPAAKPAS